MPSMSTCRPLEDNDNNNRSPNVRSDYVYAPPQISPASPSSSIEDSEEALGSRFEFQKKIISSSSSSNEPSIFLDENLDNLELVNDSSNINDDPALLNNSSMIVRVIVTSSSSSSSSTSSSELDETDSEVGDDHNVQYTVAADEPSKDKRPATLKEQKDLPDQLELKKLPKAEDEPVQDIFSAFYRAFSQDSSSSPASTPEFPGSEDKITTFTLKPVTMDAPTHPQNYQRYTQQQRQQQRRRLFRNRQLERRRALAEGNNAAAEEAARKLEFLASKLDKQVDFTTSVPFPVSSPSSLISPSKIAVSVAVSKSVGLSSPPTRKASPPTRSIKRSDEDEEIEKVQSELVSTSYFPAQRQKLHGPQTSPLIPVDSPPPPRQQPKSFLKSSPASGNPKRSKNTPLRTGSSTKTSNRHGIISGEGTSFALPKAEPSTFFEVSTTRPLHNVPRRSKITRTVSSDIGDPSLLFSLQNIQSTVRTTTKTPKVINWQEPAKVWSEPAQVWGEPAKVWGEPERVWSEPAKIWSQPEKLWSPPPPPPKLAPSPDNTQEEEELMQGDQPSQDTPMINEDSEDEPAPQGTFVVLGDDENEGDSIDGDLGRPLMLHHFTVPPNLTSQNDKPTVSVSTSVSTSISSNNGPTSRRVPPPQYQDQQAQSSQPQSHHRQYHFQHHQVISKPPSANLSSSEVSVANNNTSSDLSADDSSQQQPQQKKTGKKFGYVIEGANVRKYRVEERTPDGYIVGEYGVLNNQNAFLRGVRYTADGTINPRLIHESLMKFLSLRR